MPPLYDSAGVGPVVALTFRATVDQPQRFARSKMVGAHFGLVPRRFQSGETDYDGRISKCGDAMMRTALYEGSAGTPDTYPEMVLAQGLGHADRSPSRRQEGDRRLGATPRRHLHRMWTDGTQFRWRREANAAA
jgi:transposase